ncbi:MAG: DUF4177 domain-containing protein [Deltaproteobacteria bacterium]|nr:DUF4177 domain-containing protein [Deltaproteobacteria bacterium]MCL5792415.1 DUF4177 domain-containing protein [Deltaproteobacteria bacterium]
MDNSGGLEYKVVELSIVTDSEIEKALNEWCNKGWEFDRITYAMKEAQRRPVMAFLMFIKKGELTKDE